MSDDKNSTRQDRKRISLTEDYEIRGWTESLGVTEEQLREAVGKVGDSAEAVRQYLGK